MDRLVFIREEIEEKIICALIVIDVAIWSYVLAEIYFR